MGKSARIQRRNKYGFSGTGNHNYNLKVTGNIKDYDVIDSNNTKHKELAKFAKLYGFKHPGSKPKHILRNIVKHKLNAQTYNSLNLLRRLF